MLVCPVKSAQKIKHLSRCIYYNHRLNDFPLGFQPTDVQRDRYEVWEKNNFFNPSDDKKETFRMILPPPNITGTLHLGHALTATVQDVLARWYRMQGIPVLWIPGLDHAGIATQAVMEKHLTKTKSLNRQTLNREEFLSLTWDWKNEKSNKIKGQLKQLGFTLDWSKEFFTMSKEHNQAVIEAFLTLNDKGLLYRDKRLINWSPALRSAVSDIEVEYTAVTGKTNIQLPGYDKKVTFGQIFEISYALENGDGEIIIATTRPETIPGDVAIAVHPNDVRYGKWVGRKVRHPFKDYYMPIIADECVKMDFGTGAVKITPAHDQLDYELAKRHNLEIIDIIDEDGKLKLEAQPFENLPRYIARDKIVKELSRRGTLKSIKDHSSLIPRCSRTGDVVEYLLREQWFVKCKNMANRAVEAVRTGSLQLDPAIHERVWLDWLENVRDWCISRQIWWGHQVPAYKVETKFGENKWVVARTADEAIKNCADVLNIEQDTDVLDTWFSSALLPFSVMGWPQKTIELHKYYPLSLMETGHDIIFFWVARMVMLGLELTNQLPFKNVLLHGMLCDGRGKKMSKSLGNVILPENVIHGISFEDLQAQAHESFNSRVLNKNDLKNMLSVNAKIYPNGIPECGVDALRLTLCSHNLRNRTISFNASECQVNKFFGNKIWQASRYILLMTTDEPIKKPSQLTTIDLWILSRMAFMVNNVNDNLENRSFYKMVAAIKQFLYYEFCDFYVEGTKPGFKSEERNIVAAHRYTLAKCLEVSLRTLSPLMPYLADDLYLRLAKKLSLFSNYDSLAQASYPSLKELGEIRNVELERKMDKVLNVILSIRSLTANLNKKSEFEVHIVTDNAEEKILFEDNLNMIIAVGRVSEIKMFHSSEYLKKEEAIWDTVGLSCFIFLVLKDKVLLEHVKDKIRKKRLQMEKKLEKLTKLETMRGKDEEEKIKFQKEIDSYKEELKKMPRLM